MTQGNATVGEYPTQIFPAGSQGSLLIYNSGSTFVYIGTETSTTVGDGYPLSPGSSVSWGEYKPLYAVCRQGETGTLAYSGAATAIFDANSVASQILQQGLATSIAQQIALNGAPSIDVPLVLYRWSLHNTETWNSGIQPSEKYNTLRINVQGDAAHSNALDYYTVLVIWLIGVTPVGTNTYTVPAAADFTRITAPVKGTSILITITPSWASGTYAHPIDIVLSYKEAPANVQYIASSIVGVCDVSENTMLYSRSWAAADTVTQGPFLVSSSAGKRVRVTGYATAGTWNVLLMPINIPNFGLPRAPLILPFATADGSVQKSAEVIASHNPMALYIQKISTTGALTTHVTVIGET